MRPIRYRFTIGAYPFGPGGQLQVYLAAEQTQYTYDSLGRISALDDIGGVDDMYVMSGAQKVIACTRSE